MYSEVTFNGGGVPHDITVRCEAQEEQVMTAYMDGSTAVVKVVYPFAELDHIDAKTLSEAQAALEALPFVQGVTYPEVDA